jgi:ubiquinone/menaquinone biosynthesis C-methylase UbiE
MTKASDSWQKKMYNDNTIKESLDAMSYHILAKKEVIGFTRLFGLKKGQKLLDVACGSGRHSVLFSKNGMRVTAVDLNDKCLSFARRNRGRLKMKVEKADMQDLSQYREKFDVVLNLHSSFGYFSTDNDNEKVMKQLLSTIRPGGRIGIHILNRDWLVRQYDPSNFVWKETEKSFEVSVRNFNPETKYNQLLTVSIDKKSGKTKTVLSRMRFYSADELIAMMKRCGIKDVKVFGSYNGEKFSKLKSSHPVFTGVLRSL